MLKRFLPYLVCFSAALFFAYELVQLHMMNAIAPFLMQDLHLSATSFGYISSTYLLADILFLLPAGLLLDRFEVRKVLLSALGFCILGTLGFALSTNFWMAAFCHFFSGIGNAFCFLSCMILVTRWFAPSKQAQIMGWIITVGMLGAILAQTPFSMLAENFGWRQALYIDACIGCALFGLLYFTVLENRAQKPEANPMALLPAVREAFSRSINLKMGFYTGFLNLPLMVIGAVFGSLFLTQIHHLPLQESSFIISMIAFGTIIGSPLYGYLADRSSGRRQWMLLGAISSSAIMFLIALAPTSPLYLAALFFLLGLCTSSQVLGYPTITENSPAHLKGTSIAAAGVIIMGLPAFIQPLTGWVMDLFWNGAFTEMGNRLYPFSSFVAAFSFIPFLFLIGALLVYKPIPSAQNAKLAV